MKRKCRTKNELTILPRLVTHLPFIQLPVSLFVIARQIGGACCHSLVPNLVDVIQEFGDMGVVLLTPEALNPPLSIGVMIVPEMLCVVGEFS